MNLVHFSRAEHFRLLPIETVPDFGGGCFFYPVGAEREWPDRFRFEFTAPDGIVEIVQEFSPWEFGNPGRVIEVFVKQEHLHLVRSAKAG